MANKKITQLPTSTAPLTGAEILPVVQSSATVQTTVSDVLGATPGSSLVVYTPAGTGAVATTVQAKLRELVSAKDFGIVGNGSDETIKLQYAFNAAIGKTIIFEAGKTYGYTQLTIKANTQVVTYGAVFNRLAASTSQGFIIENGVSVDELIITTPGGASGDKGVLIKGSNVLLDKLSITAAAQGVYNSTNYALEIESIPSGTKLSNITINNFYCKYFSAGMFIKNVELMTVQTALIEYYRTGVYLRDTSKSTFDNVTCVYTASTANGAPGENGLLVESTLFSGSCFNLKFTGWSVSNAGEHSYRLGGQLTIRDVYFDNCLSSQSGSAIVVNNPSATEWHGGCGFKVLGATSVTGQKHQNIYFNNCTVEDINETYGSFPTGHGTGNFAGFQIAVASNVHISNTSVQKRLNTNYSCGYAVELLASDHVYFTDVNFTDVYFPARIYEQGSPGTYPGWDLPCEYIYLNNCLIQGRAALAWLFEISNAYQNFDHHDIYLHKCHLDGGTHAVRINPITGTGSYLKIYIDIDYTNCSADPATAVEPVIYGSGGNDVVVGNIRAPWHSAAYGPQMKDATIWQDTYQGSLYTRKSGFWRRMATVDMFAGSTTTAALTSKTDLVNTVDKISGKLIWNSTLTKLFRANGATDVSTWTAVDGSSVLTPV
jgi:hypothetical protein